MVRVATCQFPVSADIRANLRYVERQTGFAKQRGADVAATTTATPSCIASTSGGTWS